MDKKELKKILKPLMKECVKELLIEEGMLKVLSEAVQPPQQAYSNLGQLEPQQLENVKKTQPAGTTMQDQQEVRKKIEENRKRMLDEIGKKGYLNGVNPFAGTEALSEAQSPLAQSAIPSVPQKVPPAMKDIDPSDPGVNISGIMNLAAGRWKSHMGGKGK